MTARDDYPVVTQWLEIIVAPDPDLHTDPINREMRAALDEIDRLRAENEEFRAQFRTVEELALDFQRMKHELAGWHNWLAVTTHGPALPSQRPPQPRKPEKGTNMAHNPNNGV